MTPSVRTPQQRDRRFARIRRITQGIVLGSGVVSGLLVTFIASGAKPYTTVPVTVPSSAGANATSGAGSSTPSSAATPSSSGTTSGNTSPSPGASTTPTTLYTPPTTAAPVTTTTTCYSTPSGIVTCN